MVYGAFEEPIMKKAYEKLNDVADLCIKGMDDIYGAWYFGIYKSRDSSESTA